MNCIFKAELIHDLAVHKEFSRSYTQASIMRSIFNLVYCGILIWFMTMFSLPTAVRSYLMITVVFLVIYLVTHPKNGDIQYKRMLQSNHDKPLHLIYTFCEDGIHCTEPESGNKHFFHYDQFLRVIESPRLILLVMKHRSCILVDKRWLSGGSVEELLAYLFQNCPNIRRKKAIRTTFGKWSGRILTATFIIGTMLALANIPGFSLANKLTGQLHNGMAYREMADELTTLDIRISDQTIKELEAFDAEYFDSTGEDYYVDSFSNSKVSDLLYWEGCGFYDEETWQWTPSTSGVYWFDMEVINAGAIYTDFLTGVSAIHEELNFTNIQEDYSAVDAASGTGTVSFSFEWNGQTHRMEAEYNYDWFDTDILYEIGRLIAADDSKKNLYSSYDGGQGFLLYYGNPEQVRRLERKTGMDFSDTVHMQMGH